MKANTRVFRSKWFSFSLPGYRDLSGNTSLGVFSYDELPPLTDLQYEEDITWIPELQHSNRSYERLYYASRSEKRRLIRNLLNIEEEATKRGLQLPSLFLRIMKSFNVQGSLLFDNSFIFDIPKQLHESSIFENHYFIQFLRDQQHGFAWYLCLTTNGESSIVFSRGALSEQDPCQRWFPNGMQVSREWIVDNTFHCADEIGIFLYRLSLEMRLRDALYAQRALTIAEQSYLAWYQIGAKRK